MPTPSIALVYDRVNTPFGGAENVLLALHQAFPTAPLYTSVFNDKRAQWAKSFQVKPSWLQSIPGVANHHRWFVPLMPLAFESLDLDTYDIVISVTSAEAKGVLTKPNQLHICYLLTPTRYLYSHRPEYEHSQLPFQIPVIKQLAQVVFNYLTWWDQAAAYRPDVIVPISRLVANRVRRYYHRDAAKIVYPPIDIAIPKKSELLPFLPTYLPKRYLLVISRLVDYKRVDLAIQAAQQVKKPLVIVGEGPALPDLSKLAGSNTYFLGNVSSMQRAALVDQAEAVLMLGIEDFGITAIEVAMQGTPVILHSDSGAAELLPNRVVALHINQLTVKAVVSAIRHISTTSFYFSQFQKNMRKYAITNFVERFRAMVLDQWREHRERKQ